MRFNIKALLLTISLSAIGIPAQAEYIDPTILEKYEQAQFGEDRELCPNGFGHYDCTDNGRWIIYDDGSWEYIHASYWDGKLIDIEVNSTGKLGEWALSTDPLYGAIQRKVYTMRAIQYEGECVLSHFSNINGRSKTNPSNVWGYQLKPTKWCD